MGFLNDLKRMLRREATDAKKWLDDSVGDANKRLDQAERRLSADPAERLQASLDDIAANDEAFDAIRARADAASARPVAHVEVEVVDIRRSNPVTDQDPAAD